MHAHPFPFPIWDKSLEMIPPILASGRFKWKLFQLFHLSISLKSESPTVSQCGAVIVSVPFCPMRSPALCMWKDPERRREGWINNQTAFCLHHFGVCCLETPRQTCGQSMGKRRGGLASSFFCWSLSKWKMQHPTPGVKSTCSSLLFVSSYGE